MELTNSISFIPPALPSKWQEWNVEELIGQGAYGSVYRIVKEESDNLQENALKIISIPRDYEEEQTLTNEYRSKEEQQAFYKSMKEEFSREIQTMILLKNDPNIVPIIDYEIVELEVGFKIYIQMPLLVSLSDYLTENIVTEKEVIKIGMDIAGALGSCGGQQIIHRDIKPDNIFYNQSNFCLGDFGVARQVDPGQRTLSIKGSFSYMAPEIFKNQKYDARVDIYSLGLVLYRLMNRNKDPFIDQNKQLIYYQDKQDAMNKRMAGEILEAPVEASPEFASVILKACEYEPDDRYQTPDEFLKDLTLLYQGSIRKLSVSKRVKRKKKDKAKSKLILLISVCIAVVTCCMTSITYMLLHTSDAKIIQYEPSQKTIIDPKEADAAKQAVAEFDECLWESAKNQSYGELLEKYPWVSLDKCIGYFKRGYHEEMQGTNYIVVAQAKDQQDGSDIFCVNAIHYEEKPPYPEYYEKIPNILIEYAVQKDKDGQWKISTETDELRKKLISFMPEDFQRAYKNRRFVKLFNGFGCISESLDDRKGVKKEALYKGNITTELSAIWQNENDELAMLVSFSNGTDQDYVVNYFTVEINDSEENIILEYKMTADQIESNVIKAGEYLTYSNIRVYISEEQLNALNNEGITYNIYADVDPVE